MSGSDDSGGEEAAWQDLVARFDTPAVAESALAPWPPREDLPAGARPSAAPGPGGDSPGADQPGTGQARSEPADAGPPGEVSAGVVVPADRARVVRYAGDPRSYSPPEEAEDEPYVPVPLPPPAKLDALGKAAWVGLIGGPLYLLIGTFLHWTISATEAFAAVAAFVAGFVTLVIRLSDRPRDDDNDGAVL